jgi:hypothetical protein
MGEIIRKAILREDTEHPVFHGCIDWHSSVHGHWALFRIARILPGQQAGAVGADDSLSEKGIEAEIRFLRSHPRFEMPYGRAWFLRLAMEYASWCKEKKKGNAGKLRVMGDEVAASLIAHYEKRTPSPATREYANDAWALFQLGAYLKHAGKEKEGEKVAGWVKGAFLGKGPAIDFSEDARRPEFFSRFGNWVYLVAGTQDRDTLAAFLEAHPVADGALQPVRTLLRGAHHLGMNWSRAWALRALSRLAPKSEDRKRFDRAFLEHVKTGMEHHKTHADRYWAYGHWVPQFAVYAVTEGECE